MRPARSEPLEQAAALLERAYRMALVLQGRRCRDDAEIQDVSASAFEECVIARELVALLDEARASLVALASRTPGLER